MSDAVRLSLAPVQFQAAAANPAPPSRKRKADQELIEASAEEETPAKLQCVEGPSPQRQYVEFPRGECVMGSATPGVIEKLHTVLEKNGLLKHLKVEVVKDQIHFFHSKDEMITLISRYPELRPFFLSKPPVQLCIYQAKLDDQPVRPRSEMGLFESPTAKSRHIGSLIEQSDRHFESMSFPSPVEFTFRAEAPDKENLAAAYRQFQGVCIGEVHNHISSKKFLIDNMEALRALGVKTLFLEDILYDTMQPFLDEYFQTPDADIPFIVRHHQCQWDQKYGFKHPYTYENILREAKRHGIRIVGIDTSTALEVAIKGKAKKDYMQRTRAMNFVAQQIIKREKGDGRYLAFMGMAHAATVALQCKPSDPAITSIGVADMLQCPLITIRDAADGQEAPPRENLKNYVLDPKIGLSIHHVHLKLERA